MHTRVRREPSSPTPYTVARRATILSVISCRGFMEAEAGSAAPEGPVRLVQESYEWLTSLGLSDDLTDWERQLVTAPFGSLSKRDIINASWLSEAVSVLAWGLGRVELLAFDKQCDEAEAANSLGFLQPREETVLADPSLRAAAELADYNEFILNVHWRLRDFARNHNAYDFESLARKAWGEPVRRYGLRLATKDICIAGQPLSRASEEDWRTLQSITQERHRASNWLIGYEAADFYQVTTDT